MDNASATIIMYVIGYMIAFLICALITRVIFSIPTIVYNLQCQTMILEKMAKKQGISEDELSGIRNINK